MVIKDKTDELWDVYTKDRVLTGRMHRRGMPLAKEDFHLVVHVCIFNKKGEMLIQQRQPFKAHWSDMWDLSVGGAAITGDTSQTAIEREIFEEIGLKLSFDDIHPSLTIHLDGVFDDVYTIEKDLDISELKLQPEEVQTVKWATKEEIYKLLDDGVFIPYNKSLIDLLFFMRNHNGTLTNKDKM